MQKIKEFFKRTSDSVKIFFRKTAGKASLLETKTSRKLGKVGYTIDASAPIPERLRHLFTDEGYTEEGMIYKGDTSSDEVTAHFMQTLSKASSSALLLRSF